MTVGTRLAHPRFRFDYPITFYNRTLHQRRGVVARATTLSAGHRGEKRWMECPLIPGHDPQVRWTGAQRAARGGHAAVSRSPRRTHATCDMAGARGLVARLGTERIGMEAPKYVVEKSGGSISTWPCRLRRRQWETTMPRAGGLGYLTLTRQDMDAGVGPLRIVIITALACHSPPCLCRDNGSRTH